MQLEQRPLALAISFLGEAYLPGASNLIKGDPKSGLAYLAGGLVAGALIGPPAALVVAALSFSQAITGHRLIQVAPAPSNTPASAPASS